MRIQIDIGHPAHVHYFRNFIKLMTDKGHQFVVTSRDKEVTFDLLRKYNIPFISRGKGGKGFFSKILYILIADIKLIKIGLQFKPDILLSFASTYAAHASFILNKPHIAFDDTEHSQYEIFLYRPFTKVILNPQCFKKSFGRKQIRFNGFMELCYLHPNYFKPDIKILDILGLKDIDRFIIVRFVSWSAFHDIGERGFSNEEKIVLIKELSKMAKVFISSEKDLIPELAPYLLPVSPERLHDVLYYATLYIGEGATTASESVMLGTPAIYVNSISTGTLEEQEKNGLLISFRNPEGVLEKALDLLSDKDLKTRSRLRCANMISQKIDVTAFMVWFIENFPDSFFVMKQNSDFQETFK
jgi:predicted glycosyltransferase